MRIHKIVLFQTVLFFAIVSPSFAQSFEGGNGTKNDPYQISTVAQLAQLATNVNNGTTYAGKFFRLISDIDLNTDPYNAGSGWTPIGNSSSNPFRGTFEGNGKIIKNLKINSTNDYAYLGLFGYALNATIENLTLENVNITHTRNNSWVGGLVGYFAVEPNKESYLSNCSANGQISSTGYTNSIGSLVGYIRNAINTGGGNIIISNCSTSGSIEGIGDIGGLIGYNRANSTNTTIAKTVIQNCSSKSNITSNGGTAAGGFIGRNSIGTALDSIIIRQCCATGNVTGTCSSIGGFFGEVNVAHSDGVFITENCYSYNIVTTTPPTTSTNIGGFVGKTTKGAFNNCYTSSKVNPGNSTTKGAFIGANSSGSYSSCFYDKTICTLPAGGTNNPSTSVIGKTTTEMKTESTFKNAGWDFDTIWKIDEGITYPYFKPTTCVEPSYTANDTTICYAETFDLDNLIRNRQDIDTIIFATSGDVPIANPKSFTPHVGDITIYITAANDEGCVKKDTIVLTMYDSLNVGFSLNATAVSPGIYEQCDTSANSSNNILTLTITPNGGCPEATTFSATLIMPDAVTIPVGQEGIIRNIDENSVVVTWTAPPGNTKNKDIVISVPPGRSYTIRIDSLAASGTGCTTCTKIWQAP